MECGREEGEEGEVGEEGEECYGDLVSPCFSKHSAKPQECSGRFFAALDGCHQPLGPLKEALI